MIRFFEGRASHESRRKYLLIRPPNGQVMTFGFLGCAARGKPSCRSSDQMQASFRGLL
jgi:hypothetical protein